MINIPGDLDRYELVPGVSEHRLSRIIRVVARVMSIIFGATIFFVTQAIQDESSVSEMGQVIIATSLGISILILIGVNTARRRRRLLEAAAGYTTMASGRQDLNQLDPVTGIVLRRAGSVVTTTPKHHVATVGKRSGAVVNASSLDRVVRFVDDPPSVQKKIAIWGLAIFAIALTAVALSVLFASSQGPSADGLTFQQEGRIGLAGFGMLVTLIAVGTAISQRAKLRAANLVRPDAFVFLTQRTPEIIDALKSTGADRPRLPRHFAVTLGPKGIELWGRGRTEVPRYALPWNDIEYVHPGRLAVEFGNFSVTFSVTVQALHFFQTVDGRPIDLPFTMFGPRGMNQATTEDANKVLHACSRYTSIA